MELSFTGICKLHSLKDRIHTLQATTEPLSKPENGDSREQSGKLRRKESGGTGEMLHVFVYVYMCVCKYVYVCVHMCSCVHVCMNMCASMYMCGVCVHACMSVCTCVGMYSLHGNKNTVKQNSRRDRQDLGWWVECESSQLHSPYPCLTLKVLPPSVEGPENQINGTLDWQLWSFPSSQSPACPDLWPALRSNLQRSCNWAWNPVKRPCPVPAQSPSVSSWGQPCPCLGFCFLMYK